MIEAFELRVDFIISTNSSSRAITTRRSPTDMLQTPPDIMVTEKICVANGSAPVPEQAGKAEIVKQERNDQQRNHAQHVNLLDTETLFPASA